MILTSYFARSARAPGAVSIARFPPKWYTGARYPPLAPVTDMLKIHDWILYRKRYQDEILSGLDPDTVIRELEELVPGSDILLLCFEKDRTRCHRSLVAEWLFETKEIRVPEIGEETEIHRIL